MAEFVIVTGMSGAGRSTTAGALEDLGWFVIDNLPPAIIPRVGELVSSGNGGSQRVALVVGRPGGAEATELIEAIVRLREGGHLVRLLFLDAADDVLVRRYEGTRRRHPRSGTGVEEAIAEERIAFEGLRERADIVLETGELNATQLRSRIAEVFGEALAADAMRTTIMSFGFKHGLPMDVDMVFDARFLPNPHWIDELRDMTGLEAPVREYVLGNEQAQAFTERLVDLLDFLLPAFLAEGKSYLTIGIGCTGGHHRSVAIAEEVSRRLREGDHPISIFHRDVER
jgi:UPF0042 nucleotide-binding protein